MNDLAFVMGTALDLTDNGKILCSLQVAIPAATGSGSATGGGSGNHEKFYVIYAEGKNGNEIHRLLQKKSSRTLTYSHRSVVYISERLARHGINNAMDIFTHDPRNRLKTYMMVVKGTEAKKILEINYPLKQVPIETVKVFDGSGDDLAVTLRDFYITHLSEGIQPVLGVIEPDIHGKSSQLFRFTGAGVFKGLKLAGLLDEQETLAMMWVMNKLKFGRITTDLPHGEGEIGMMLMHTRSKITTQAGHDGVKFKVRLFGEGSLVESNTPLTVTKPADLKRMKKALEDSVRKEVQDLILKTQTKLRADSMGFGHEMYKYAPVKWAGLSDQWDTQFPRANISVDVSLRLHGAGMVSSSIEFRDKEMDK
ncbi:Ger(x)C family spore germination protein [Paenibacillus sp. R14(2021)]|uniref:Ger(x)C family spore germination protein n=1 Tax=Paenibacillus sp. R14(2021) TaxID=2859228 RepID=UPI0021571524|nr:Ger(x)C family spore germination protein [Paenibacillus sp. R14(2021)]